MIDNIAASSNGTGIDLVSTTDGIALLKTFDLNNIADPVVRHHFLDAGYSEVTVNNLPMRGIEGMQVYNSNRGIHTWLHARDSGDMEGRFTFGTPFSHEFRSIIRDTTVWNVQSGIHNFYSTRIDYEDSLVVGNIEDPIIFRGSTQGNNARGIGITHNAGNANYIRFNDIRVEGFQYGFQIFNPHNNTIDDVTPYTVSSLANARFAHVDYAFAPNVRDHRRTFDYSDLFVLDEASTFAQSTGFVNIAPTASFDFVDGEGLSVVLDADTSIDPDPSPLIDPAVHDGIAAYAWDLDDDGRFDDAFGERILINLEAGTHSIGLKVWDDRGATGTITRMVTSGPDPTGPPFLDPHFDEPGPFAGSAYSTWSGRREEGWIAREVTRHPDGFAEIDNAPFQFGGIGQLVRDQHVRRGVQTFSFDLLNIDASNRRTNNLIIDVYGIDGQWGGRIDADDDPSALFASPDPAVTSLLYVDLGQMSLDDWTTFTYDLDLGSDGYKYLFSASCSAATIGRAAITWPSTTST